MNAYLFNASVTRAQALPAGNGFRFAADGMRTWDACMSLIVCAGNPDEAHRWFEDWLRAQPDGQPAIQTQINRIVAVLFMDQMLTETENVSINWPLVAEASDPTTDSTPADGFEPGYWVDVNEVVSAQESSSSAETLRRSLPEDIRSGLNWSADKKFLFILSVLSPPPPPAEHAHEMEVEVSSDAEALEDNPETLDMIGLAQEHMNYPELMDKETAVLIQARNSVVAAWLWRKFASGTPLAENAIRIDPWYGAIGPAESGGA